MQNWKIDFLKSLTEKPHFTTELVGPQREREVQVRHADLRPYTGPRFPGARYRVCCPVCKTGLLLVNRCPYTGYQTAVDYCVDCGQRVRYTDILELRGRDRVTSSAFLAGKLA
jgi:hypothetical protein